MSLSYTTVQTEFCVVGGGLAGVCAAIAAARHGIKTVLVHERPVLGGNASSEIRMPISGAPGEGNLEGGLIEEWTLENLRRNPENDPHLCDRILFDMVAREENITLFLSTTCTAAERADTRIVSVTGWQMTSHSFVTVRARYFADCSGDGLFHLLADAPILEEDAPADEVQSVPDVPAADFRPALPVGRASRRLLGDYVLTEKDVLSGEDFPDAVAYGARAQGPGAARQTQIPPYIVPYRCLYSRDIENLFFAGGHISMTRAAMTAAGGMATAAILGQAAGTAAAIASKYETTPRGVYKHHMPELQETLLYDDCFLPYRRRTACEAALDAELSCDDTVSGDILNLRRGADRCHHTFGAGDQGFTMACGASVEYSMDTPTEVTRVRIVFDSDLDRACAEKMPGALAKVYALEMETPSGWEGVLFENENTRRLVTAAVCRPVTGIRLTVMETWGAPAVHMLSFDFE